MNNIIKSTLALGVVVAAVNGCTIPPSAETDAERHILRTEHLG
jgi:hypothetical protein